jgi:ubiquinone/menaquinone biosynthesis C-methylase UbiE
MASNPPLQSEAAPVKAGSLVRQFRSPEGWLGRFLLWDMNRRHSRVTDWGLNPISVTTSGTILDVGCGGGRTISKLAARAPQGKVYGIDHSSESVAAATKTNAESIGAGRVQIQHASLSELPFPDDLFDLVTAVETHFWWPDMPAGMREIRRVLKPGGALVIVGEMYKGATTKTAQIAENTSTKQGWPFSPSTNIALSSKTPPTSRFKSRPHPERDGSASAAENLSHQARFVDTCNA